MGNDEFEERYNVEEVTRKLFKALYRDKQDKNKYFITIDGNFIETFYAEDLKEAINYFYN